MSALQRSLRGNCSCGRNTWILNVPQDTYERPQLLFHTESKHRVPTANPLAIRVPLSWYRSQIHPFFPDETNSAIRRVFESSHQPSKRCFCGFCGTPLSYWTEHPQTEADYIHLTLASLCGEDMRNLEDLGLIPELDEMEHQPAVPTTTTRVIGRETRGVPWLESMLDGSRLGNLRRSQGVERSSDGKVRVEWDIVEWTDADDESSAAPMTEDADMMTVQSGKRKLDECDRADAATGGMH